MSAPAASIADASAVEVYRSPIPWLGRQRQRMLHTRARQFSIACPSSRRRRQDGNPKIEPACVLFSCLFVPCCMRYHQLPLPFRLGSLNKDVDENPTPSGDGEGSTGQKRFLHNIMRHIFSFVDPRSMRLAAIVCNTDAFE